MDLKRLRRRTNTILTMGAVMLGITALTLLAQTARNPAEFGEVQFAILVANALGVLVLLLLIVANLFRLLREYWRREPGVRLKARMVGTLVALSVLPLLVVYVFAVDFLGRGVDAWFDAELEQEMNEALRLSRAALDVELRSRFADTRQLGQELRGVSDAQLGASLNAMRARTGASELTLFGESTRVLASSTDAPAGVLQVLPPDDVLLQARQTGSYLALEPLTEGYQVRALVSFPRDPSRLDQDVLQAVYPVGERLWRLADAVQATYTEYAELRYLRGPLNTASVLTLTLVLLLSMLAAVFGAFFFTRRLLAPLDSLVSGTRAVAAGDFDTRLPATSADEVGFLIRSFNEMIDRLRRAREDSFTSQRQLESERANLATILARLTAGVIALDEQGRIRIANAAAGAILQAELPAAGGQALDALAAADSLLGQFHAACMRQFAAGQDEWQEQLVLRTQGGARRILNCVSTLLPADTHSTGGRLLVFDDITSLVQAQRDAAWGEVARRLAHEIKNPLTPIRLAAERIRRRYLPGMPAEEAQVLDRSTHTIVQQVEAMRDMVNAFSDYARAPQMRVASVDLNQLVREVAWLYRVQDSQPTVTLSLDKRLGEIPADQVRLRQLLHNLIRNALEAQDPQQAGASVLVETGLVEVNGREMARIAVTDNGPGIDPVALPQIFEPYVTTKKKGTGLGLAIVKRLVEEHGGSVQAENLPAGGARITLHLPLRGPQRENEAPPGSHEGLRERV
ncbi:MAG: HAMP domain-containing protein [Chromatiales bacterium]|nr:HAMP domain-containing protein [Chromatiales bacterium]